MSLEEYIIRKLEERIATSETRIAELEAKTESMEDWAVDIDYLKSIIEKVCPEAKEEKWWDDIFM